MPAASGSRARPMALTPEAPLDAADARFLARVDAALEQGIADSAFGVAELARAVHVDRATLFRRLKELRSSTPSELIRERRLARARDLLSEPVKKPSSS